MFLAIFLFVQYTKSWQCETGTSAGELRAEPRAAQHRCAVPMWYSVVPKSSFFIVVPLVLPNKLEEISNDIPCQ